jgi:beta-galactosidase
VKLYRNEIYVNTFYPKEFKGLKHGPICIDDTIGDLLKTQENFAPHQERLIHDALLQAKKYGNGSLPPKALLELAWCMVRYKMKYEEGVSLYGKYVGGWGGGSTAWKFEGIKDGETVKTVIKAANTRYHLEIKASSCILHDGDTYDMAAFRIRILDEYDNLCSYVQLPVSIHIEGPFELIGPSLITAEGGMCGTYIRTIGKHGKGRIVFSASQAGETELSLTAE